MALEYSGGRYSELLRQGTIVERASDDNRDEPDQKYWEEEFLLKIKIRQGLRETWASSHYGRCLKMY